MIVLNQKQKRVLLILGVAAILLLAIVAIITAIRLQQVGTEPVAPTVPKSKPKAAEVTSQKTWMIVSGATLTPSVTVIRSPELTATNIPQPTNTPVSLANGPTAIPTVGEQSLPQAGGVLPTIGAAVGGLGIILLGLLLLL